MFYNLHLRDGKNYKEINLEADAFQYLSATDDLIFYRGNAIFKVFKIHDILYFCEYMK